MASLEEFPSTRSGDDEDSDRVRTDSTSRLMKGDPITLQVGEQHFVTTVDTMTRESGFFAALLSDRWNSRQKDGSFFVDADPKLFEYVLRYLRRGVLPLFYNQHKGHDYAMYAALLEEAKYFQIPRLQKWLSEKKYIDAVRTTVRVIESEQTEGLIQVYNSNVDFEITREHRTRQVYVCPRDVYIHRGKPQACGRRCRAALTDEAPKYETEEYTQLVIVSKTTVFDGDVCIADRYAEL